MSASATARVPTQSASRYLQQLCKHWEHNLAVTFDASRGTIVFPRDARGSSWAGDATVTLIAHDTDLECRIDASVPGQLAALEDAVARHLDRFAFREAPLAFAWQAA
ncbi:DUF2218 domain-containing protein [Altererythrobacter aerius]|uniref:DUF2218 domain-containing protein n=1 Tax=Tsuneonella aeria TaxID=1837929 RepID=A0A6I4TBX9_9SPHN|nr:DUF2218 domain-containing protein [Tsuneonella aeria]